MKSILVSAAMLMSTIGSAQVSNFDANHCEFYTNSFAIYRTGHYGIPVTEVVSDFVVNVAKDSLSAVGQWVQYKDLLTGEIKEDTLYANLSNVYDPHRISFITSVNHPAAGHIERELIQFAYFVETEEADGSSKRLWQSNYGSNFYLSEVMTAPTYTVPIAYGRGEYSNEDSSLFYLKKSCD